MLGRKERENSAVNSQIRSRASTGGTTAQEISVIAGPQVDRDIAGYAFVASFSRILLGLFVLVGLGLIVLVGLGLIAFLRLSKKQGYRRVKGKESV